MDDDNRRPGCIIAIVLFGVVMLGLAAYDSITNPREPVSHCNAGMKAGDYPPGAP